MKIKIIFLIVISLAFILLLGVPALAENVNSSPHWPSARAMLWLGAVGGTDAVQKATYSWEAQHYDVILCMTAGYVDYVRSVNPTILGPGTYDQFTNAIDGSNQIQAIQDQATRLGLNAEDAYVHLKKDTVSSLTSSTNVSQNYSWLKWNSTTQKVTIPGWDPANDRNGDGYVDDTEFANLANPNATARSRNQARFATWSWNPPQWKLNLGAFDLVKALIDLINSTKLAFANFTIIAFDGVDGYYGYGSTFWEYPHTTGGNPDTDFASDEAALIRYTKQLYGGQVLIFGNSCGGNWKVDQELDGSYREMYLSTYWTYDGWETGIHPFSSTSPYYLARQTGKIQGLQIQYNTLGAGDTPENWVKERIFGVGAYYLLQNPGKDYWAGWNTVAYWPSLENNEKMWSHALEVDIGMPTGHTPDGATVISPWGVWTFATGADPGHPDYPDINKSRYKIYAREYTKGLVLLKPRSGTATYPGSRSADNTATTHNLSSTTDNPTGRYYQVKDDGTIDTTPLTTITLRNGEAAILIKESAINDTTPPTISNVRNSTITNSSAIILWNTDESSNSAVYYGTTTTLGQQKSDANLMVAHSIQLTGLTPITFYYYKASSCDATGNCANSSLQNFTTLAIAQQCIENWTCTQWSACINKTQTRTCTDLSNCGTTNNKPTETRRCGNFTKIKIKGNLKFSTGQACSSCDITITFIDSTSSATTDSSGYFELTLQPSTPFAAMSYIINGTVKHQLTEIKFKRTISIV